MSQTLLADILQLSVSERIQLVQDIWDTIATAPENLALSDAQQEELDRRLESYRQNPESGASWNEVKERISSQP